MSNINLTTYNLINNFLIELNDEFGMTKLGFKDFQEMTKILHTKNRKSFDICISPIWNEIDFVNNILWEVNKNANIDIERENIKDINLTCKTPKYFNIVCNKGDISFLLKEKEISEQMRFDNRSILDIEMYSKIKDTVKDCFNPKLENKKDKGKE